MASVLAGETDATLVYRPHFYYYMQKDVDPSNGEDPCSLLIVGHTIHNTGFAFAFHNQDNDFVHFSHILIDLKVSGAINRIINTDKYVIGPQAISDYESQCFNQVTDTVAFTADEFIGLFIMCGAILGIAVILKIGEILWYFMFQRKNSKKVVTDAKNNPVGKVKVKANDEDDENRNLMERILKIGLEVAVKEYIDKEKKKSM